MDLRFKDQANSFDKENNEMKILVYKNEDDEFICPKCGEKIQLNIEKINNIILSNDKIKDSIIGIKMQLENIINNKNTSINLINIQLNNITILLNALNEDIQNINEKIKHLLNDNDNIINNNQIKIYNYGKYEGQLINNKREGKGKFY